MNQAPSYHPRRSDTGYTIVEALVSTFLTTIAMGTLVGSVIFMRDSYFTDVARSNLRSNLRSAMDITSMNIRQAGENLQSSFPAVLLTNGASGGPDVLKLRRGLLPEVLTLCANAAAGATSLQVSLAATANTSCIVSNVTASYNAFSALRTSLGGTTQAYLYNSTTNVGEFVNYTANTTSGGQYYLTINGLGAAFTAIATSIYLIEEYSFELDAANTTYNVYINDDRTTPNAVAFSINSFSVLFDMNDNTSLTVYPGSSTLTWKDIEQINLTFGGIESFKNRTLSTSISAEYFPRNVLSGN